MRSRSIASVFVVREGTTEFIVRKIDSLGWTRIVRRFGTISLKMVALGVCLNWMMISVLDSFNAVPQYHIVSTYFHLLSPSPFAVTLHPGIMFTYLSQPSTRKVPQPTSHSLFSQLLHRKSHISSLPGHLLRP